MILSIWLVQMIQCLLVIKVLWSTTVNGEKLLIDQKAVCRYLNMTNRLSAFFFFLVYPVWYWKKLNESQWIRIRSTHLSIVKPNFLVFTGIAQGLNSEIRPSPWRLQMIEPHLLPLPLLFRWWPWGSHSLYSRLMSPVIVSLKPSIDDGHNN